MANKKIYTDQKIIELVKIKINPPADSEEKNEEDT